MLKRKLFYAAVAAALLPSAVLVAHTATTAQAAQHKVMVIVGENHSRAEAMANMPYLAGLASTYGQATAYKAVSHPSLPNYLAIWGGSTFGITTDCSVGSSNCVPPAPSVWRQTLDAGETAKAYQESMPSNCDTSDSGNYAPRHGPWPYWIGTIERGYCGTNDVPMGTTTSGNLLNDVNGGSLPVTGEMTPNLCNDAHDCSLGTFDTWLKNWIPVLMNGPDYQAGNLSIVITFDEDDGSAGNNVAFVVIDPSLHGVTVSTSFDHYALTKWLDDNAGVSDLRSAATAGDLRAAFGLGPAPSPSPSATSPSPSPSATSPSPSPSPTPPASGSVTLTPTADSYVNSGTTTTNYGSSTTLQASASSNRTLLRFDTSGAVPAGDTITGASLSLYVTANGATSGGLEFHPEADTWAENTVTWSNQPAWNTSVLATSVTPPVNARTSTALPVSAVNLSGNTDLGVRYTVINHTIRMDSRETASPPQLVVTWAPATSPTNILDRLDFIKATEIGEWQTNGQPTVSQPIAQETVDGGFKVIRYSVYDCFTGQTCGSDNHAGSLSRATFDTTIQAIRDNIHPAALWLKMLPTSSDCCGSVNATSFCPPWTGPANQNLPTYEDIVNETHLAGWTGPLVLEMSNEMYFDCTAGTNGVWDVQSGTNLDGGSVGVSKRVGEHYAQTGPPLKAYAQTLGFQQVVVGDDIGVPGGAQWGQSFVADPNGPYGYTWTYSNRWINEFNNAVLAAGVPAPDFEAWHAYPHSPDNYVSAPYEGSLGDPTSVTDDDQILYSYFRGQIADYRARVDSIWGATTGDQIRFAISEGSAGDSESTGTWGGWTTPGRPEQWFDGWLHMLQGNGQLTGPTGTRYWEFTDFCDACNSDTGSDRFYNIIHQDGTLPSWYSTFKNFTP